MRWLRARPALLVVVGLAFIAIWEVAVLWHAKAAVTDWDAIAAKVRAGHQPGDLITVEPAWQDPNMRLHLGDRLTLEQVARMSERRFGRIWRIDARRGSVKLEERAAPEVVWETRPRAKLLEVDFAPRLCVPLSVGRPLSLGRVTLGSSISAHAGLSDFRSRKENHSRAEVRLLVDGQVVGSATVGNDGWIHLGEAAVTPGEHEVAFEASVVGKGRPQTLSLCVAAESYR